MRAWSRGGATDVVNGQALCPACNLKKGNRAMAKEASWAWQRRAIDAILQHTSKDFLLEATPGAGKSRVMAAVAKAALLRREVDAVLVFVPTYALRLQMADTFSETAGIQLDPKWDGTSALVRGGAMGAVVTYQSLASCVLDYRKALARYRVQLMLDEVHHANEDLAWGDLLRQGCEGAVKRLLTSGTPFRSDNGRIPFARYQGERNVAIPDFRYSYGDALQDGIVRSVFFNRHAGIMSWTVDDEERRAKFNDDLRDAGDRKRLLTALDVRGDHLGSLLAQGVAKLDELRLYDTDAGGIVIAMNTLHANAIAARLRKEFGQDPAIIHGGDKDDGAKDDASAQIKQFKGGTRRWIVCVGMVREGVDIPRLRVLILATNVGTEMFFRQAVGRIVRVEEGQDDHTAHCFLPD